MKKFLKGLTLASFALVAAVTTLNTANAQGAVIKFNKWTDVPGIGTESNFVRIGDKDGGENVEACENGQKVNVWFYLHNGTSEDLNGTNRDGEGVAKGTKLKVNTSQGLNTASKTHTISGVISADNAASVSDTVTITCGSEEVKLKYNGVVSFNTTNTEGGYTLNGDPINGAYVGFTDGTTKGVVPGCWKFRASTVVQFEVVKEEEPKDFTLKCEVLNFAAIENKKNAFKITVNASADPAAAATVSSSKIKITGSNNVNSEFDGLVVSDYTFPDAAGTYKVVATVNFTIADGYKTVNETSVTCERGLEITVDKPPVEKPPVTPPVTKITNTGAGTNIALFAAVVVASSFAYRKYLAKRG